MTTIQFEMLATTICALREFTNAKDIREFCKSLNFEIQRDKLRVIATDGHILGVYKNDGLDLPIRDKICCSIPISFFKELKSTKAGFVSFTLNFSDKDCKKGQFIVRDGALSIEGELSTTFIHIWRTVIPTEISGEAAQFNPELLARLHKITKITGGTKSSFYLFYNGERGGLVKFPFSNLLGVIMPLRSETVNEAIKDLNVTSFIAE